MRVLVCGGRNYGNDARVFAVLDKLHSAEGIDLLIEGGARGADHFAWAWSKMHGVPTERYEAEWEHFGKMAGGMRNSRMLAEGRPDLVVAFPGGSGTADMVRKARRAGVEVVEIAP